ncbi:ShKT domain-containing protein [Trichostrongylus colubriformis]|uniref:ShKT domain-containing protein n=1 Tax=Trichostrongylus colubriformis TaxID=6319 RepID=A0AAN8F6Z7_TRICO
MVFSGLRSEDDGHLVALVYKFIFANEAICGDAFSDPDWLPAANKCFVKCDATVYLCMVHTKSSIQKCRTYPKECQAAIRKHLGWTRRVVSVFRPPITTTPSSHLNSRVDTVDRFSRDEEVLSQRDSMNADRSAVEAAEYIERDLMGVDAATSPSFSDMGRNDASMAVEMITTSPPSSYEQGWLQGPRAEVDGYSFEGAPSFITETPPQQINEPPESIPEEYEGQREVVGPLMFNVDSSQSSRSGVRQYEYALPQAPPPKPSPPAIQPYQVPSPPMVSNYIEPPPEKELVPKYINFLEVPEENGNDADEEPLEFESRAPSFSDKEYTAEQDRGPPTNVDWNIPDPVTQSTTPLWSIPLRRPYQHMQIVPSHTAVALPEGSAIRGMALGSEHEDGSHFEVIPALAQLASAIPMGVASREPNRIRELPPHVQQFGTSSSRQKVFAEVQPEKARDHSRRCCEWSLSGLCDRHWRPVRKLCPKSCGSLVCDDIDGIKSCTRIVDVDVEDCFQSSRLSRYFGLKNAETEEEKRSIIDSVVQQKLKRITL